MDSKKIIISILCIAFGITGTDLNAQQGLLKLGDRYFEQFSYAKAIEYYEQAFRKNDASSIPHARRLGECYWNLRDIPNAERWYAIVAASSQATPEDVYRYAEMLRVSGQYADSELWLKRYAKLAPDDNRVILQENATERLGELMEGPALTHKVTLADFSSGSADLAPFIHGNTVYFASSRADQFTSRHTHSWNDQPFLNLYTGRLDPDGSISNIKPMGDNMNTHYHESNAVVSADGSELYFTRNNIVEGRGVLSDEGVNNLQIFTRSMLPEGWSKETAFPYNSPAYSIGHPAITKDGKRLYFTSDMPGGLGGKDLYFCERDERGEWMEPVNLGSNVNTEGAEMFPYVFDGTLYFSSDGHLGLGGLDLFRTTIRGKSHGRVENLNAPINSTADDLGFCLNDAGDIGFFTSDRDGAIGKENIYTFRMNSKAEENRVWVGRVLDIGDAQPIPFLPIRILDMDRNEIGRTVTSVNGTFEFSAPNEAVIISVKIPGGELFELPHDEFVVNKFGDTELPDLYLNSMMDLPVNAIIRDQQTDEWVAGVNITVRDMHNGTILFMGTTNDKGITQGQIPYRRFGEDASFEISFEREGYFTQKSIVDFRILGFSEQSLTGPEGIALSPVLTGIDIAKAMNLRPIYFDYRESKIRSDAAKELDQVAQVMFSNPGISIALNSHSDSRASTEYNDALSQKRADSSRRYLIEQGISPERITAKGMGERKLVNKCADGVECSEEEHQMNRRTEFIITQCMNCGLASAGSK